MRLIRFLSILLLILFSGCSTPPEGESITRVVYGLTLSPQGFDPHRNESSELGIPMRQVYDTLIYRNPLEEGRGGFVPGLATDWTISEDRLSYTFNLRQDVQFHDGTPFNALAVGANLDRITNPATRSTKALTLLGPYTGYEINSEYSITILLSEPYSPLLDSLSQVYLGIASPTALARYENEPERYQFHQAGTGPYILEELLLDNHIRLRRNPQYRWGPSFYPSTTEGMIEEIEYRFFTDAATRFIQLEAGEAQIMGEIPPLTARSLTGNSQIKLVPAPIPGQPLQFLFNTQRFPTDNVTFRQALLYATNRSAIVDVVFQSFSPVAWGPITSNTQFYNRAMEGLYDYDLQQAESLITSLGYLDADENGFLDDPSGGDIELVLVAPPWGSIRQVAELLQQQWQVLKIRTTILPVPDFTTLLNEVNEGEYNLAANYAFGIDPVFLNSFFMSNGSRNWTGYSNPDLDALLIDASRQLDGSTRARLYGDAQRLIMENALILPIREYINLNATTATITDLQFDVYGWFPLMPNVRIIH
jgi:peptide/nickel transport system substrate-binding protein